jgi:hypothetical protein
MTNFENILTQEQIDQQVVDSTIADIEAFLRDAAQPEKRDVYLEARAYIEDLYTEFAPDISTEARMVGAMLGAAGLALAEERYGRDEYSPRLYGGTYEDRVLATYHHAGHSRLFIRNMFVYAAKVNQVEPGTYDQDAYARFPIIGAFHDLIMGNGRGNDEHQSALLASQMMKRLGFVLDEDPETEAGIDGTVWNDELEAQSVREDDEYLPYRRAAAVADLMNVFTEAEGYLVVGLIIEDMCKHKEGQLFTKEADAAGFLLEGVTIEDCLRFVDSRPALRAKFAEMLNGQAGFVAEFKAADPRMDALFPGRAANIAFMNELAARYSAGELSALEVLYASRDFMREA